MKSSQKTAISFSEDMKILEFVKQTIRLFEIRKEERKAAILSALAFTVLNVLNVVRYFDALTSVGKDPWNTFIKGWHVSGFDPITYSVITKWSCGYNIYRHPLLAYFVWPFTKLNELLMEVFGMNFSIIITAVLLVFFATYSYLFLSRIFWEIIGTSRREAYVLSALNFSFAFVLLSTLVPDHFCPSMFCLILTLYLCGRKLQRGRALNWWQTVLMFFFTAGISLNNGLKIFLMAFVTRRKRFFRPGYLIVAVLLPSALMWGAARLGYAHFVWPKEVARKERNEKFRNKQLERIQNQAIAKLNTTDTALIAKAKDSVKTALAEKREKRRKMSAAYKHTGKPMAKGEFIGWTDVSTSRTDVAVECLFGEGIMLHEDYLLGDVLVNRPVIVRYHNWFNYIVEAFLVGLFLIGVWFGRRSLFCWTALSFFLMDMLLHMGLGFGINEIFIMSPHYLFVLPVAMAFFLKRLPDVPRRGLTMGIAALTAYLTVWNVALLVEYLFVL